MRRARTLPAFANTEKMLAHSLLAARVAYMMGRKFEEDDWAEVYCRSKGIQKSGWSNLNIDIAHDLLGVEHKMMKVGSRGDIIENCGQSMMHPSATRSIRIPADKTDADDAMRNILEQYAELIIARTEKLKQSASSKGEPDMRTGWLLWQESLRQFLYFEEEMIPPNPDDYTAEWVSRASRGARKPSTNLWIYEKETRRKRYSVTTEAGAKIQPYFDIPPATDPNLYVFTVIGEVLQTGMVRVWITDATHRELNRLIGDTKSENLSKVILETVKAVKSLEVRDDAMPERAHPLVISQQAYQALQNTLPGVSDEQCFQLLLEYIRSINQS